MVRKKWKTKIIAAAMFGAFYAAGMTGTVNAEEAEPEEVTAVSEEAGAEEVTDVSEEAEPEKVTDVSEEAEPEKVTDVSEEKEPECVTAAAENGWVTSGETTYYYIDGEKVVSKVITIDGARYMIPGMNPEIPHP